MEKYGFVYIWRDKKHNRYYIGSHWGKEDDGYICSSTWMMQAYKHRPNDFKRRILERVYSNRQDLLKAEYRWLSMIKEEEIKVRYYNLNIKATGHWSAYPENVKTIKEKISYKTKEAMQRDDVRQNYLESMKDRDTKSSHEDVRRKRSVTMKATLAKKGKWPLNDPPDMTDRRRLWKDGKYKLAKPDTEQYEQLRDEGWVTKKEHLMNLVEKFRHDVDDHASDMKTIAWRMINVGYITDKDYYRYLK